MVETGVSFSPCSLFIWAPNEPLVVSYYGVVIHDVRLDVVRLDVVVAELIAEMSAAVAEKAFWV